MSFSLGTDTAGSGRVPAAFNNLVGLKPTLGLVSTRGVVPACRSLDCVSIFGLTVRDTLSVLEVAQGFDAQDPYSRRAPAGAVAIRERFLFGVPRKADLEFFGDREHERLFAASLERLTALGGELRRARLRPVPRDGPAALRGPVARGALAGGARAP